MHAEPTFLERIAAGDSLAVNGCLEKYRGLAWSMARRFVGNHTDAKDAVQEIFVELWRHAGRFDAAVAAESTFVATVARRRLIDRHRRRVRQPGTVPLVAEPPAAARSEADILEGLEEAQHARRLLEQLPPEQRQVLELSFDQGMAVIKVIAFGKGKVRLQQFADAKICLLAVGRKTPPVGKPLTDQPLVLAAAGLGVPLAEVVIFAVERDDSLPGGAMVAIRRDFLLGHVRLLFPLESGNYRISFQLSSRTAQRRQVS